MNTEIFYAASIVASVAGMYLLWVFGFQPLFVDEFRDALFTVRDRLYGMAADDRISPDHPAYRSLERLINGLIRFAHMFNLTFLVAIHFETADRREQADPQFDINRAIASVRSEQVRSDLEAIEVSIKCLVDKQMSRASIPMLILSRIVVPLSRRKDRRRRAIRTFEREAYNAPTIESKHLKVAVA